MTGRVKARCVAGLRDERGATAVFFAVGLLLLAPATMGLIDVYMITTQRGQLQDALDTATLYVARSNVTSATEVESKGDGALAANLKLPQGQVITSSTFVLEGITIKGSATITPPTVGPRFWVQADIAATSEVLRNSNNVEVALVLDTTGSMAAPKITDLKAAANELVDVVVQDVQTPYFSKVAVVPYAMAVNMGSSSLATQVRGAVTSGTSTTPGKTEFRFKNASSNTDRTFTITNCVTERSGAEAYTDAAPSVAPLGRNYRSDGCSVPAVMPLSSDKASLKTMINGLTANGSTGGHVGVAWGWYMVSPNFASLWSTAAAKPLDYGTTDLLKVVVLMTDGEYNSAYCKGVISADSTNGSGSASDHINCNAPNGHSFDQATKLCAEMKKKGVIVYTVGFQVVNDQRARDLVNNCATSTQHVYLPSTGGALKDAFRAIGQDINSLRISK